MSAKYKSPSFLLPNELNTSANPANDTGVNSLYSMDFDGGSETISLNTSTISFADSFSISMWINPSSLSGFQMLFSGSGYSGGNGIAHYIYNNTVRTYASASGSATQIFQSSALLSTGSWTHIVIQREKGTNWEMWIDGVLEETNTSARLTDDLTSANSTIAKHYNNSSYNFNGKIDEVAIFNRALDSTEIAALYGGTSPNIYPSNIMASNLNPIAYYPLGEQAQNSGYPSATGNEWQFPNGVLQDYVMDFDGSDDFIDAGDIPLEGVYTISFWINPDASPSSLYFLLDKGDGNSNISARVTQSSNDTIRFQIGSSNFSSTDTLTNNSWNNVILIANGSSSKIYINNGTAATGTLTTAANTTQSLFIGTDVGKQSAYYFNGEMSNVVVWNSDQSTNIDNIYNNGSPQTTYTVTPQNWWKLNADSVYTPSAPNYTKALDFVASESDYIDAGNPTSLQITGALTISYWFKTTNTGYQFIVTKDDGTNSCFDIGLRQQKIYAIIYSSGLTDIQTTTTWTDGKWHNVVFVFTPSTSMEIFVDGNSEVIEEIGIPASIDNDPVNLNIGRKGNNTRYYTGQLSNAAIFNSALSASQVSTLFNFGTPETNISFDPQAWWKLDDQTAITDSSGNGNTGTNNGATDIFSGVAVTPSWKIPSALPIQAPNYTTALDFNNGNKVTLSSLNNFVTNNFTASIWVNYATLPASYRGNPMGATNGSGWETGFGFVNNGITGKLMFIVQNWDNNPTGSGGIVNSTTTFTTNQWFHLAGTWDGSTVTFYINGISQGTATYTGSLSTSDVLSIGTNLSSDSYDIDAILSNAAIFNTALPAAGTESVASLYNQGTPLDISSYSSLKGWWKLDSTTITDSSGNGNTGTNNGATQVTSDVLTPQPVNGVSTTLPSTALQQSDLQFDSPYSNYSLYFDGTGDNINVGNIQSLQGSFNFSISAWINLSASFSNRIFGSWDTSASKRIVGFAVSSVNTLVLQVSNNGTSFEQRYSTSTISTNVWAHVVVTFSSGNVNFYINGSVETPSNTTITQLYNVSSDYFIGALNSSEVTPMNGNIDETSIFNTELTSAQVLEIYNNGRPKDLTTFSGTAPISWWRLGENAYFDNNSFIVPNSITGAPNGTGAGSITTMISADAPGTYANGIGTNLDILDRVGDAPLSTANSQSYNMIPSDISSYVPGYVGDQIANNFSMSFDSASSDYIEIQDSTTNTFGFANKTGSISAWIKINDLSAERPIASKRETGNPGKRQWMLLVGTDAKVKFYAYNTDSQSDLTTSISTLSTGQWYHITVTLTSTQTKIYIDGSLDVPYTNTYSSIQNDQADLNIGRRGANADIRYFDGEIDEVAIFDKALTAGQIFNDLYQPTETGTNKTADFVNNPNLPNPVAWYRMGD